MKINKPVSIIIIAVITLLIVFLFAIPKYQESLVLQETVSQKQAEFTGKSNYYATIADLTQKIESNPESVAKINSALPPDFYLSSLVYFLQQKASEAGLVARLVVFSKITEPLPDRKPRSVNFTVNVAGNYQGLKTFLDSLDTSSRLFEVNSIYFRSESASDTSQKPIKISQKTYSFSIELETRAY